MFKSYKYLIKPNAEQREAIKKNFEGISKIYNMYISDLKSNVAIPKRAVDIYDNFVKKDRMLLEYNKQILINELFRISDKKEYKNYRTNSHYPKTYTCPILPRQKDKLYLRDKYINIPYIGEVKIEYSRPIPNEGNIKSFSITEKENKKYYIIILVEVSIESEKIINIENSIGLDYSSKYFAVDNNGNKYAIPHFYREKQKIIEKKQYELSRCKINGSNYNKKKIELFNLHENIANRRKDYLHKLSTNMANTYDCIFVEDIDLIDISQNNNLGKATYDNSYGIFISMLEYKMKERRKVFRRIDKWFPSTKKCSVCGYINRNIELSDRSWLCPNCGTFHDRDINAAINIRNEGIKMITNSLDERTAKAESPFRHINLTN